MVPPLKPLEDSSIELDAQCAVRSCDPATDALTDDARDALYRALDDERRAEALYRDIVEQLGAQPPFSNIVHAERRHIAALARLLESHGDIVPTSPLPSPQPVFESFTAACRAGVASEILTAAMYSELLQTSLPDDVRCVFDRLRAAAEDRHLPAFQRCAAAP